MEHCSSPLTRPPIHAILLWGNQSKSLRVLIDSGADENFWDATLVSELGIPTQPLSLPMDVRVLDGCAIGRVTHNTTLIILRLTGYHSEAIQFMLIKSPQLPVVLRLSWLQRHNPLRLNCWCHYGLETVLPRPLSEVSAACPGMSSWGLGRCPGPFYHPRGVPGPQGGVQQGPSHFVSTALTL